MPNKRMNKAIAGYHLLMILSAVDFRISSEKDMVIRQYLVDEFPFNVNLDKQMEVISRLRPDEWEGHYLKVMDDFYDDSTDAERKNLINFAIVLTKADNVITREENHYLNLLFDAWHAE